MGSACCHEEQLHAGMPCPIGERYSINSLNNETVFKGSECWDEEQLQCVKITLSKTRSACIQTLDSFFN